MTDRLYYVEIKYTVAERFRIVASSEPEARRIAKSNDHNPFESVRFAERVTGSWPLDTTSQID
jgi:hypothetical protein